MSDLNSNSTHRIPPIKKSELHHAEFGKYSSGYYDLPSLDGSSREHIQETLRISSQNLGGFIKAVDISRASLDVFFEKTKEVSHHFFTILDPELLECLLRLEDAHNDLDIAVMDSGIILDTKVSLYSLSFMSTLIEIHKLQQLLLSRATRRLTMEEWKRDISAKVDRYTALCGK